jgi:putative endopeptidase
MCGAFPADEILKGWGMDQVNQYDVTEPAYMKALADIYTVENLELLRDWLTVRTTEQWANYLDKDTRDDVKAAYDGALGIRGTEGDELEAAGIIFNDLGIPADNLYIAKYCTPELRDEIREIIDAIIAEYHNMLAEETWLSEATREKAIEKLDNLAVRAVYPDNPDHW